MRNQLHLAACLLAPLTTAVGTTLEALEPAARLSLAEAVNEALQKNDRLVGLRESTEQAGLSLRLARSQFRPKVTPNILGSFGQTDVANQTYRVDATQRFTTGTEMRLSVGAATLRNQIGNFYATDTTLQLSQPLLRGFGSAARRQLTSAEIRRADAARQETLGSHLLVVEVARAYYRVVSQGQLEAVAEKALDRARGLLEASEAKLQAGRVSQLDVFRAQQLVAQAEGQLLDSRAAIDDARDQLAFLMGRESDTALEVDLDIPRAIEPLAMEEAEAIALGNRSEIDSAEDLAADAERATSFAKNQMLPQVDLNLALTRRETADSLSSSFRLDNFRIATFVAISMPSDRTQQNIQYHTALLERDRSRRELRTLRMRVRDEARRAVRQQQRLLRALETAEASEGFAEKELEVAELRYQRGLSNNLDVVSAEAGLLAARSRRIAILAELAVARLGLRATLGVLDPRRDLASVEPIE